MTKRKKEKLDTYDSGYNNGYYDAVYSLSWECGDCGNRYDPSITKCPNEYIHKAYLNSHDN
jgi:hypothetical protein